MMTWFTLTIHAARLSWEAQSAVALGLMRFAGGGSAAQSGASGAIPEIAASSEAQGALITAVAEDSNGAPRGEKMARVRKTKMRAKRKLLAGKNLAGKNLAGKDLAGKNLVGKDLAGKDLAGKKTPSPKRGRRSR